MEEDEKTRRKSFRGDVDVISNVMKNTKRHSFRGDIELGEEKMKSKEKRRSSFRSSYAYRNTEKRVESYNKSKMKRDDSLDVLINESAKIKKSRSDGKKKRGGSLNIKRSSSFFDRFKRSRSQDAPQTKFTTLYDCEMNEENLSKFRQRRHSRNIENCADNLLLSSVTLTLDSGDALDSTSHLAMEVARMKFEETEKAIMELERKKKEEMKNMRRNKKKKKKKSFSRRHSHHE